LSEYSGCPEFDGGRKLDFAAINVMVLTRQTVREIIDLEQELG
jgi:hypothetical protein